MSIPEHGSAAAEPAPSDLGPRGVRFWSMAADAYELAPHELEVLHEIARTLDELDALRRVLTADGPTAMGSAGQVVAHPALGELRGARNVMVKLLHELDLPMPDEDGAVQVPDVFAQRRSEKARHAANVKWGNV